MFVLALNIFFVIIIITLIVYAFKREFNETGFAIIFYFIVLFLNIYFALLSIKKLF